MIVIAKKIEPPPVETKVTVTLDMTLPEAVELYYELGKTPVGTPLARSVRQALKTAGINY